MFLSLLLLMSSMGFTVSTHFCGGHAVESVLAIGDKDINCGVMDTVQQQVDHQHGEAKVIETTCCSNEYSEYNIEDNYNVEVSSNDMNDTFSFAFIYTYLSTNFSENDIIRPYVCYDSPPLIYDLPVLNQSFLI